MSLTSYRVFRIFRAILFRLLYTLTSTFLGLFKNTILKSISSYDSLLIIRDDNIGDCVHTLPFLLSYLLSHSQRKEIFVLSPFLEQYFSDHDINVPGLTFINSAVVCRNSLVLNMAGRTKKYIKKMTGCSSRSIISQIDILPNFSKGLPLLAPCAYSLTVSQSHYVSSFFETIGESFHSSYVELCPILKQLANKVEDGNKLVLIHLGFGLDELRQMPLEVIVKIKNCCDILGYKLLLVGYVTFTQAIIDISQQLTIDYLILASFVDLHKIILKADLSIGFDSGPVHYTSIISRSLTLLSHSSFKQWGPQLWHTNITSTKYSEHLYFTKAMNSISNKNNYWLSTDFSCIPCHKWFCGPKPCYNVIAHISDDFLFVFLSEILTNYDD